MCLHERVYVCISKCTCISVPVRASIMTSALQPRTVPGAIKCSIVVQRSFNCMSHYITDILHHYINISSHIAYRGRTISDSYDRIMINIGHSVIY